MVQVMSNNDPLYPTVIMLSRGDVFYATHAVPNDVERYARVDRIKSGEYRMIMKRQCIAVVEEFWESRAGAGLVVFMREDRIAEGVYQMWFAKPQEIPDLRDALAYLDVPQVHVVTSVTDAVVYHDEVLVPNHRERGPYGWIVKREDVSRYIAALPAVRDSGKMEQMRIWVETHVRPGGKRYPLIRIEGWSKPPEAFRTSATLCALSEYVITFDTGSRRIKCITLTNASVDFVYCATGPLRGIAVGRRLPTNLARRKW